MPSQECSQAAQMTALQTSYDGQVTLWSLTTDKSYALDFLGTDI